MKNTHSGVRFQGRKTQQEITPIMHTVPRMLEFEMNEYETIRL